MIVVDVLLALNLIVFMVCAVRAPRAGRPSIDELVAAARRPSAVAVAAVLPDNVVPLRSRAELRLAHAQAIHPSRHAP